MKELLGKKIIGFKFEDSEFSCGYAETMDKYINEIGEITSINEKGDICEVLFNDGETWSYPTELIKKQLFEPTIPTLEEFKEKCETANELLKSYEDKPIQYQIGIDAIGIAEKNMTIDECLAIARFNITKYSYRKKNQDLEDYKKIISYANWAIKLLNKK